MKIQLNNLERYTNLIFFDIEYDQNSLVQLALLILNQNEPNIFELQKSVNIYVKLNQSLSPFFVKYTNITDEFLCDNGIDLTVARTLVNEVISDIDVNNSVVISHGVKNDLDILLHNNIDLKKIKNHYCTYNMAKKIFKRNERLSLKDVAAEGCYCCFDEHNAYADVWATLYAFCALNEFERK